MTKAELLGPAQLRVLAEKFNISPTKKLGQNFVIDPNTIRKIVALGKVSPEDTVLEVGPGLGSLTLGLLEKAAKVEVVELDENLAEHLPETIAHYAPTCKDQLIVIQQDAVYIDSLPLSPTVLVANLPYNVAVPILLNILKRFSTIDHGLIMVQKEVAERLTASPANKVYGVPTLKASWYAQLNYAGTIGKKVFWPAPKIDSGLVFFQRQKPLGDEELRDKVFELIDLAFSQRRKTIRTALNSWNKRHPEHTIDIEQSRVDVSLRPENLTIQDFISLMKGTKEGQ
ncbi:MAG: 16S rRNA (adenine(1518)-N(6)/adenine(1519)-N(6))-dimethyltransferase RsmA [Micrococcaceae bacterium]